MLNEILEVGILGFNHRILSLDFDFISTWFSNIFEYGHFNFIFFSLLFSHDLGFDTHIFGMTKLPLFYFIVFRLRVFYFEFFLGEWPIKEFLIKSYYSLIKLFAGFILFLDIISVGDFYFYFCHQNSPIALTIFCLSIALFETSVEKSSFDKNYQLEASSSQVDGGTKVVSVMKFLGNIDGDIMPVVALAFLDYFFITKEGKRGDVGIYFAIE